MTIQNRVSGKVDLICIHRNNISGLQNASNASNYLRRYVNILRADISSCENDSTSQHPSDYVNILGFTYTVRSTLYTRLYVFKYFKLISFPAKFKCGSAPI